MKIFPRYELRPKYLGERRVRAVGNYLKRWGFAPQRPIKCAYEQRPEAVQEWLEHEYPAIEQRVRAEGAEIHWGDETALIKTDVRGRSYAPCGKTPVTLAVGGTREKLSIILSPSPTKAAPTE